MMDARAPFSPLDDADPAVPGDPFVRVRYNFGQLLGAEDFSTEQRAVVLRRRLHNAALHGTGVVAGLGVRKHEKVAGDELQVAAGLAVDPIGRDIWVDQLQCLEVAGLHTTKLWARLTADLDGKRTAYVVLRYGACLADAVPAIGPGCRDIDAVPTFSRIEDAFTLCLEAEAPPDPHASTRPWNGFEGGSDTLRAKWLAWSLQDADGLAKSWTEEDLAGVALARVVLRIDGDATTGHVTRIDAVDVSVRPLLPSVQALAEQVTGHRLVGPDARRRLRVATIAAPVVSGTDLVVHVALTGAPVAATLGAVGLQALGSAWAAVSATIAASGDGIDVTFAAPAAETTFQLVLRGAGPGPLLGDRSQPLDGWWDDPMSPEGRGRDVSFTFTWKP